MNPDLLTGIGGIVLVLLGGGGLVALWKVRPEASQIAVSAAEGAVLIQTGIIDDLREENHRLAERLTELERTSANVDDLKRRIEVLEDERDQLLAQNRALTSRVRTLETELRKVENGTRET